MNCHEIFNNKIRNIKKNTYKYFFRLISINYYNNLFSIFIIHLIFASLQGRSGHFIYRTRISRNNDCREHDSLRTHQSKRGRKIFSRRVMRSECTCVKHKSSEKFRNGNWLRLWSIFSSFSRNRQYPNA